MSRSETNDWRGRGGARAWPRAAHRGGRCQPERGGGRGRGGTTVLRGSEAARADGHFRAVIVVAIYFLVPRGRVRGRAREARRGQQGLARVAFAFGLVMFASYVAPSSGVSSASVRLTWGESYEITMAGLAATRLFSAGGAGGIVLTYWALRKARMSRKETAARMVAFLVLLYAVYLLTLVINGILLRAGVLSGPAPAGLTIVPAAIAGGVIVVFLLRWSRATSSAASRTPRRRSSGAGWRGAWPPSRRPPRSASARRSPTSASPSGEGWRSSARSGSGRRRSASSGPRFTPSTPRCLAVVIQGFFVGMFANNPLPGGVGGVDAGMIGAFALFDLGLGSATLFAAVLTYRLIAFWLPLVPGIIAFFQLRTTVRRWKRERPGPAASAPRSPNRCRALPLLQKVKCDRFGLGEGTSRWLTIALRT